MTDAPSPPVPRVSVVICYYNGAPFLAEAIDSVLAQTWADFELILVDDGSTDDSPRIAREYAERDQRVFLAQHPDHANHGLSASRNAGIALARAETIALLDADDVWREDKLAAQLAILEANPSVAMVCGGARYWRSWSGGADRTVPTGSGRPGVVEPPHAALDFAPLGRQSAPCPSDLMLRRKAILAVGGFEETFRGPLAFFEDQAFLLKLYLAFPIYVSDQIWLSYRKHDRSISSTAGQTGTARATRAHFLKWYGGYLKRRGDAPPAVVVALTWARLKQALRGWIRPAA
jgi:glycosyltransferase involved in cell wall biosynthesis